MKKNSISGVECPCARWFPKGTPEGYYDWDEWAPPVCLSDDPTPPPRGHLTNINYFCPHGHVFDTSALHEDFRPSTSDVMTWTCASYADWYPPIQPKCVRK